MSLIRLTYRSQNAMRMPAQRMMIHYNDIVTTARANNPRMGVCGFLMFDRVHFYQVLEGEKAAVHALYASISRDVRHEKVELLSETPIAQPYFSDWSMASFLSDDSSHPLLVKHRIKPNVLIQAEDFIRFAMDFVSLDSEADVT
jgi:hypothetical protein